MGYEVKEIDNGILIKNVSDFELPHIFDCGQCFRWNRDSDGSYVGVAFGRVVRVIKKDDDVIIKGGSLQDSELWINYFDLRRDYSAMKNELSHDSVLNEAVKHGYGIRILNQEPFEILISFILSANNRIPMIKRAVEKISEWYGKEIEFEGRTYYAFPSPDELRRASVEELNECGSGFRAPYIHEGTQRICNGEFDLNTISKLETDAAQKELMKFKGVGPKVADCILLFSMEKMDAFPVDVWVKRIMEHFYLDKDISLLKIREFGRKKFGTLAGIAQQYLFYYAREKRIGTKI